MSEILNLNDTTPAAGAGYVLGKWQKSSTPSGTDPTTGYPYFDASVEVPLGGGLTSVQETPSGTLNGVNKIFTLANTPNPAASCIAYLNGVEQDQTRWVTLSGATLTWTVAPKATDFIRVSYTH